MINVASARAALDAIEGEKVELTKAQYSEILTEVARGNAARISLTNVRSILGASALAAGIN
ncbi:hypothetical protein PX554_13715 [Sphingomonas sp. H39-1-10]|uniref:hypothetical protein n=1 Tax=Sphingomonas pollutisoli TaxID=3030829 RepID=UPI0023B8B7D6|nr:hypothetical protein [Sphingomonas pollutisoli]MDF0489193.1 hypothetical protein [Sphingomonas pollutisoli]